MRTKFIYLLFAALISACSGGPASNDTKPTDPLKASKIYDNQVIREYAEKVAHSNNLDISNDYLKKGEEAQKANNSKAAYFYKRAITYLPSVKAYSMLGKYLLYKKQYEESIEALSTSIGAFKPREVETYGDYLVAQVLSSRAISSYLFADAINGGAFSAKDIASYLEKKWPIVYKKKLRVIGPFINNLESGTIEEDYAEFEDSEENIPVLFKKFWDEVPPLQEPFAIGKNDLENFDYYNNDEEGYYFEKFYPECRVEDPPYLRTNFIARMTPMNDFNRENPNPAYKAIIYKVDSSAQGSRKNIRMIYYRLCTYTPTGAIIDHKVIAAQLGERFETCTLQNGVFTVNTSKRKWSKPFTGRDFDNDLLATEFVSTAKYVIDETGKIVEAL